ncbi:MAG: LysR family transcriptional regulator [Bacteroidetes bacterium]|nr:LysR family transcriptional regulator [Bacteroidota bacterium]
MTDIIFEEQRCSHIWYRMFKVRGNIWIESENGALIGVGRMKLLEQIDELGSITAAARAMKMSYRQAWELVDSMNTQAKQALVETSTGGVGGGGTTVTHEGKKAIKQYKKLLESFDEFQNKETGRLKF